MLLSVDTLEIHFAQSDFGLSARRLWEHTELGQMNVFAESISARPELNDPNRFIDVVWTVGSEFLLTGFTLSDLRAGIFPQGTEVEDQQIPKVDTETASVIAYVLRVKRHLDQCTLRKAMRNQHQQFLPVASDGDVFDIPGLFSLLQRRLKDMGSHRAGAEQWKGTIANFQKKGLRTQELAYSGLGIQLEAIPVNADKLSANELANYCDFGRLRMSVIPVVRDAQRQLRFTSAPKRKLAKTIGQPKAQLGQRRFVSRFDPVLGYRIERVEHQSLWGQESHWQAVTFKGQVLLDSKGKALLSNAELASAVAELHAKQNFPKRISLGRWNHLAWNGGSDYREWLLTLPLFRATYFSSHFSVRNVLLHIRCDTRVGADDERVLVLQEVQSDWAQNARREIAYGELEPDAQECPPFIKEWPLLAMKLVLLHAAHSGFEAVAWTSGAHQAFRYNGLGAVGLAELYDKTLPREVNRLMKPFGIACEELGVFVPTNFSIRQSESGYEVFTAENTLLGVSPTLDDAKELVPDGAHELLYEVHGVRLTEASRKSIRMDGFPAWG